MTVELTGDGLRLEDVLRVARADATVELAPGVAGRVRAARAVVEAALDGDEPVYGVTTGVGVRKRTRVDPSEAAEFNRRLILEHRVGQGNAAPADVVRAQLLLVAHGFARGTSVVTLELLEHLISRLNEGVTPHVRTLGSIGMADLPANADLAHDVLDGFELSAGEGLALLDHNAFSTALASLALADAVSLLDSLTSQPRSTSKRSAATYRSSTPPQACRRRPSTGLRALLEGSYRCTPGAARNLQDPLSFRGVPHPRRRPGRPSHRPSGCSAIELVRPAGEPLPGRRRGRFISVGQLRVAAAGGRARLPADRARALPHARPRALREAPAGAAVTGLPEGSPPWGRAEGGLSEFEVDAQRSLLEAPPLVAPVSAIPSEAPPTHEGIEDRVTPSRRSPRAGWPSWSSSASASRRSSSSSPRRRSISVARRRSEWEPGPCTGASPRARAAATARRRAAAGPRARACASPSSRRLSNLV